MVEEKIEEDNEIVEFEDLEDFRERINGFIDNLKESKDNFIIKMELSNLINKMQKERHDRNSEGKWYAKN